MRQNLPQDARRAVVFPFTCFRLITAIVDPTAVLQTLNRVLLTAFATQETKPI
jgi:hypothetical protein